MVMLQFNIVARFQFTPKAAQHYAMFADIERVRQVDLFATSNPQAHWNDGLGAH